MRGAYSTYNHYRARRPWRVWVVVSLPNSRHKYNRRFISRQDRQGDK
jgi:hypothetical protein